MAVGRVEQVISLRGENKTKQAVEEAKAGIASLAATTNTIAEKSGDLERGFRGVSDIVGKVGGVDLSGLTDQLGGIEALIKGFAGAFSPVGIAIAAVGAGATYWYQKQQEAQKALIDGEKKKIELATSDLQKTADRYLVEAQIFGIEEDRTELTKIRNTLQELFNKQKESEIALAEASLNKDKDKADLLRNEIATRQDAIKAQRDQAREILKAERDRQELEKERIDKTKRKELDLDLKILTNDFVAFSQKSQKARKELEYKNTVERIKTLQEQLSVLYTQDIYYGHTRVDIAEKLKTLQGESFSLQRKLIEDDRARAEKGKQYAADQRSALVALSQAQAEAADNAGADEQEVYELKIKAIRDAEAAEIKAARLAEGTQIAKAAKIETIQLGARIKEQKLQEEAFSRTADLQKQSEEGAKRVADAKLAAQDALTKAQITSASSPAARFDLTIADLKIQAERKLQEVRTNNLLDSESRAQREQAIAIELAQAVKQAEKEKKDAIAETNAKLNESRTKTIASVSDTISGAAAFISKQEQGMLALRIESVKAAENVQIEYAKNTIASERDRNNAIKAIQDDSIRKQQELADSHLNVGNAMIEAAKQAKELSANWSNNTNKAGSLIGAVGNVASAFVDGEREKAGILAIMETAQAIAAVAIGDVPGAIAHGSAAALYGSVAGGLISGGGAAAASAAGGGGFAAGGATAGGTGGPSGPATTVINFNAPLGTAYEIGKSVVKAQRAAGSSGWSPNMAMGV